MTLESGYVNGVSCPLAAPSQHERSRHKARTLCRVAGIQAPVLGMAT
jgi:hypothetical protein